ncbi:proteinase, putative [Metarhizium acridum CQMa 102]|uniref:Proteinase, putative n=1 Tax=Metarhizium acridum (strain CQMa 102) TaxID=655827 RepID=E9EGH6_METAQ|nr:proteinase, putative [Metarhizium acridum CQMa 102]EFY84990.1 proteinase, putative [Metarhizium acridum CQMa 102]
MGYSGTASVARDMVKVSDKIAQLRCRQRGPEPDEGSNGDVARVQYLGFLYGTVVGHCFASLFPERVGRLIRDGVADPTDDASGPGGTTALADTDKVRDAFFSGCHHAGSSRCALRRTSHKSGEQIESRFNKWLQQLDDTHLTPIGPSGDVRIITGDDVRAYMFSALYAPLATFQTMVSDFDSAMTSNTTGLFENTTA